MKSPNVELLFNIESELREAGITQEIIETDFTWVLMGALAESVHAEVWVQSLEKAKAAVLIAYSRKHPIPLVEKGGAA